MPSTACPSSLIVLIAVWARTSDHTTDKQLLLLNPQGQGRLESKQSLGQARGMKIQGYKLNQSL